MKELVDNILIEMEMFIKNAMANLDGNKAAGTRARTGSSRICQLLKRYRAKGIEAEKAAKTQK